MPRRDSPFELNDGRHWHNDLEDTMEPSPDVMERASETLIGQLRREVPCGPSVYTGSCGVALMWLHLADLPRWDTSICLSNALHLSQSVPQTSRRIPATFLAGSPGVWAIRAAIYHKMGDVSMSWTLVNRLLDFHRVVRNLPTEECELLYGRCGYLQAILFLRRRFNIPDLGRNVAVSVIRDVINSGRSRARSSANIANLGLYYEWHNKAYLGAAHGYAGILYVLLQFPDELREAGFSKNLLSDVASNVLAFAFRSGNIPSSLENTQDRLVHWCHGAPGWVDTCVALGKISEAICLGEVIWARGLLSTKGLGLCHGIPGNGYALLSLWRATGNAIWLRRARLFATLAAEYADYILYKADEPYSLFEGAAGAVCFLQDCLTPSKATTVFFDRFPRTSNS